MKRTERPILMNAPMVRAILAGTKTMTRRVVKLRRADWPFSPQHDEWIACPFGEAGDRLWVRETWAIARGADESRRADWQYQGWPIWYRADGARRFTFATDGGPAFMEREERWRPSIHMPRWASRIVLEVTDVRAERLQSISEEDARAEGVELPRCTYVLPARGGGMDREASDARPCGKNSCPRHGRLDRYRAAFASLWDSLASDGARWADSPWVWAISFRRVT